MGNVTSKGLFDEPQPSFSGNRKTIALLGDSVTTQCSQYTAGTGQTAPAYPDAEYGDLYPNGYWNWAGALLEQRLRLILIVSGSGWTAANGLANIGYVLSANPGYCLVMFGANDIAGGASAATVMGNLEKICDQLTSAGIAVILGHNEGSSTINSAAEHEEFALLHSLIAEYAMATPGVIAVDTQAGMLDDSVADPKSTTTYTDGVHPTISGAIWMGERIYDALYNVIPEQDIFPVHRAGDVGVGISNPVQSGTGGTLTNNGSGTITGTDVADTWTLTFGATRNPDATIAKVARASQNGSWMQVDVTSSSASAASGEVFNYTSTQVTDTNSGLSAGDRIICYVELEMDALAGDHHFNGISIKLNVDNTPSSWQTPQAMRRQGADPVYQSAPSKSWVVCTPEITVTSDIVGTNVELHCYATATGVGESATFTVRIGRVAIIKTNSFSQVH